MTDKRIHLAPAVLRLAAMTTVSGDATLLEIQDGGEALSIMVYRAHGDVTTAIESILSSGPLVVISAPAFGVCPFSDRPTRVGFIGTAREIADIDANWSPSALADLDPEVVSGHEPVLFVWDVLGIEPAEDATGFDVGLASCITARCGEGPDAVRRVIVSGAPFQVRNQVEAAKVARNPMVLWLQHRRGIHHKTAGVPLDIGFVQVLRRQPVPIP